MTYKNDALCQAKRPSISENSREPDMSFKGPIPRHHPVNARQLLRDYKERRLALTVLDRRAGEVYVHYKGTDKRLDEWLDESDIYVLQPNPKFNGVVAKTSASSSGASSPVPVVSAPVASSGPGYNTRKRKRSTSQANASTSSPTSSTHHHHHHPNHHPKRQSVARRFSNATSNANGSTSTDVIVEEKAQSTRAEERQVQMSKSEATRLSVSSGYVNGVDVEGEEGRERREHDQINARRNFDKVNFGEWQIKTWYFSPYPLFEDDELSTTAPSGRAPPPAHKIHNVARTTQRSHGRTADMLAGGLGREGSDDTPLWVCDRCFKYMRDGRSLKLHADKCKLLSPPGRKVYQRGAHFIWEVDGAKEKLYCQNLSLFGKLFIDVKTLFFDCDNFLFYILTDADSNRDHVLGFFSKEKMSFDDYNLATIIVLPPYQLKGYGTLLIEFSYELSRRDHKLGTPERPLSDLGLRSYLTYWIAVLVRFFRRVLTVTPPDSAPTTTTTTTDETLLRSPSRRKKVKGAEGDGPLTPDEVRLLNEDASFGFFRRTHSTPNPDGSATTHMTIKCTLEEISRATHLRTEDVAFAMAECGLLMRRKKAPSMANPEEEEEVIMVSREMIERVASERRVKPRTMLYREHVRLD